MACMDGVLPRKARGQNGQLSFLFKHTQDFFLPSLHSAYTLAFNLFMSDSQRIPRSFPDETEAETVSCSDLFCARKSDSGCANRAKTCSQPGVRPGRTPV